MRRLGFIGTGAISTYFIEGLLAAGHRNPILVSPRSEDLSLSLADRFETVTRARSNAEVSEESDIVFLGVRPAQVEEALQDVRFRPGQIVCSFITGLRLPELGGIAPSSTVCRVLPLPAIATRKGPVVHFPAVPDIERLIAPLGDVVIPHSEDELVAMGSASGFMSTYFEMQESLVTWLGGKGVSEEAANLYVRSMLSGLAETGLVSTEPLLGLADEHETKGGLNERTRRHLRENGWFDQIAKALDSVRQFSRSELQ
ncbi:NAD(P)-binding domain-containing protein [Ciceribacter sp. L1K22]|uniref:NAD(P)-binding domain-containing protein n=1 Tax=Ciceribacter sp. L1K22 TaxID=2820275 RepID=UPI001ABE4B3D|nr:NAD(P)-binding domain-containing protein [Ciceribacter sp. L1K22]MBO3759282.1 NAD(P)-binding domain-containing protein [Ciceribacter sp. L1K22]